MGGGEEGDGRGMEEGKREGRRERGGGRGEGRRGGRGGMGRMAASPQRTLASIWHACPNEFVQPGGSIELEKANVRSEFRVRELMPFRLYGRC